MCAVHHVRAVFRRFSLTDANSNTVVEAVADSERKTSNIYTGTEQHNMSKTSPVVLRDVVGVEAPPIEETADITIRTQVSAPLDLMSIQFQNKR